MKARNGLIIPLLAILVGTCMIVTAIGTVRVSNVAERNNQVSDVSSLVHIEIQPPTSGTSWVNGSTLVGTTLSCKVYWSATAPINQASVVIFFHKDTVINTTDVSLSWSMGAFTPTVFENTAPDTIRGVIGLSSFAIVAGDHPTYDVQLSYNVPGNYDVQLYVEGIPA